MVLFSSLPEELHLESLCDAEDLRKVRNIIESNPGQWQTVEKIALRLGWAPGRTGEKIRCAIKELQAMRVPIVTGHAGVTLATNPEMVAAALERERHRLQGLQRSIRHLSEIHDAMMNGTQGQLEWWRA